MDKNNTIKNQTIPIPLTFSPSIIPSDSLNQNDIVNISRMVILTSLLDF